MCSSTLKKRVGIIGGMGPEATVLLMTRIIQLTPATDDCDHVPLLIDNNTQVPSRIKALIERKGADPAPVIQNMATMLEKNGAQALAMPCNTAHYYAPQIQQAVHIPLLDMLELSAEQIFLNPRKPGCVGVLGSPAVKQLGLFDKALSKYNISVNYPMDQDLMLRAIRALKSDSRNAEARLIFRQACEELSDQGSEILVIGCSEFSIISEINPVALSTIDTIDVLAQAVVDFSTGHSVGAYNQKNIKDLLQRK